MGLGGVMSGVPTAAAMVPAAAVNYDGRLFRPLEGDPGGEAPSGLYHQDGDLVWVEIRGGAVRAGRLVGHAGPDGTLDAAYCMALAGGGLVAGRCTSLPTVLADGRLRLEERWRRIDGTSGVSWIEEVRNDEH
jgi:hypothetical protein